MGRICISESETQPPPGCVVHQFLRPALSFLFIS